MLTYALHSLEIEMSRSEGGGGRQSLRVDMLRDLSGNSEGSESDPPAPQALTPHMPWKMRLHAIMGAAKALVYLHASEVRALTEA